MSIGRFDRPVSWLVFCALGILWLASFRIADALTFFKTYSSIWFLPAGVTMAIVMAAPGWLKLAPLFANLLVALPPVRAVIGVSVVNDYEPILHGLRLFAIYGGAGYLLSRLVRVALPPTGLRDFQWITAITLGAATLATVTGIGMHMLAGNMTWDDAKTIAWSWWLGDAIGAFALPPMLVPLLAGLTGREGADWRWPAFRSWLEQAGLVLGMFILCAGAFHLSGGAVQLWPLLIVPPLVFALRGGIAPAATAIFLTMVSVPVLAAIFSLQGELVSLRPLLLVTTIAGLLLGAAMTDRQHVLNRLEQLVAARTQALSEAHEFQRHLIRSIGHDLRQPIEGMNMMLEGALAQSRDPEGRATLEKTRQIGALASQLLSTILTYARFDAGKLRIDARRFELSRLFVALDDLFAPFAALKTVQLVWEETDLVLCTDENLLRQALSNLIDNAIRLSEPGASITIGIENGDASLAIVVCDSVAPTTRTAGAAGFGLEILANIANLLGAKILVHENRRGLAFPHTVLG